MDVYMRGSGSCLPFERRWTIMFLLDDDKFIDHNNIRFFNFELYTNAINIPINKEEFDYIFSHVCDYDLKDARYCFFHYNMLDNYKVEKAWIKTCERRSHLHKIEFERKNPYPYALYTHRYK